MLMASIPTTEDKKEGEVESPEEIEGLFR